MWETCCSGSTCGEEVCGRLAVMVQLVGKKCVGDLP